MRILVADDSQVIRNKLKTILDSAGFETTAVKDGTSAWEALGTDKYRLAILDWMMPGLDGVQICEKLSQTAKLERIHVILLTGRDRPAEIAQAFAAGANDYVLKSCSEVELLARVHAAQRLIELQSRLTQSQKLESIGQLAAGVAHEINTPIQYIGDNIRFLRDAWTEAMRALTAYQGLVTAIRTHADVDAALDIVTGAIATADLDFLTDETPSAIQQSLDGAERVTQIVRAMKEFAHPGGAEKTLADVHQILRNTLTVSRNEWKYTADVKLEFADNVPLVPCLPGDLGQVFLNLIVNAAQAIGEKCHGDRRGLITLRTTCQDDFATIEIADTGNGIPEAIQHRVFDPFFTSKPVGRGTGQGLTIARAIIVEKHNGTLEFTTHAGIGTTFTVRLPIARTTPTLSPGTPEPVYEKTCAICG